MDFVFSRANGDNTAIPLTINFTVGGTATFTTDYTVSGADTFTTSSGSVTIPIGQLSKTIVVTPVPDTVFEDNETIILTPQAQAGVFQIGGTASVTGTILNDDADPAPPSLVLLHFDGTNNSTIITDSASPPNTVTAAGGAVISTAQSKFGVSSLSCPGTAAGFITIADSAVVELGSGNFTIECWLRLAVSGNYFLGKGDAATAAGSAINWQMGNSCIFYVGSTAFVLNTPAPALNQFAHLAVTRQGGTLRYFIDGQQQSTLAISGAINNVTQGIKIGAYGPSGTQCHVDEFRMVNSCEYAANFTPRATPYTN